MKSKANIKSHPIHPIMIAFPIAFFTGALVFDVLGLIAGRPSFHDTARYLDAAGVAGGLIAAIPGFMDYMYTVPPESTAKKRATKHALINIANVVLFAIVFFYRRQAGASIYLITGLELAGIVLLSIAGWMGGTLVYRNQIGVDPRYASAGKWKEKYFDQESGSVEVAKTGELQLNQMQLLHIGHKRIVLARTEDGYKAFDDHCSHRGGSLAGGALICGTVQCPWHGSQFDVHTGEVKSGPAKDRIGTYPVTEKEGRIWIKV